MCIYTIFNSFATRINDSTFVITEHFSLKHVLLIRYTKRNIYEIFSEGYLNLFNNIDTNKI